MSLVVVTLCGSFMMNVIGCSFIVWFYQDECHWLLECVGDVSRIVVRVMPLVCEKTTTIGQMIIAAFFCIQLQCLDLFTGAITTIVCCGVAYVNRLFSISLSVCLHIPICRLKR